jgi:hypothetical protein
MIITKHINKQIKMIKGNKKRSNVKENAGHAVILKTKGIRY